MQAFYGYPIWYEYNLFWFILTSNSHVVDSYGIMAGVVSLDIF